MRKAALQLSIETIVTVIIAVTLLVFGIIFLRQIVGGASEIQDDLDQQTELELNRILERGDQLALPFNTQKLHRGESHLFGLGILNIGVSSQFSVSYIRLSNAADEKNRRITLTAAQLSEWFRYDTNPVTIGPNERHIANILVIVPDNAQSGTYIFNVEVTRDGTLYDRIKKIYVIVP